MNNQTPITDEPFCFYSAYELHNAKITGGDVERYQKQFDEELATYQRLLSIERKYNVIFGKV